MAKTTTSAKQTRKPTAKPAAKKATPAKAKAAAKKTTPAKKAAARTKAEKPEIVTAKLTPVKTKGALTRRPPNTPNIPHNILQSVIQNLTYAKNALDQYAAHLRALDRKRLNNIGNKREGFAQRAYRIAMDNPEFLPATLPKKTTPKTTTTTQSCKPPSCWTGK